MSASIGDILEIVRNLNSFITHPSTAHRERRAVQNENPNRNTIFTCLNPFTPLLVASAVSLHRVTRLPAKRALAFCDKAATPSTRLPQCVFV
jgi:hypothetical protein